MEGNEQTHSQRQAQNAPLPTREVDVVQGRAGGGGLHQRIEQGQRVLLAVRPAVQGVVAQVQVLQLGLREG